MAENELVNIDNTQLATSGDGLDFGSKMFQLKPVTLSLNQPMTQADGAIPGKLRINETGEQYATMRVVMIAQPAESSDYHVGVGEMVKRPENLMCFTRDMIQPHGKSRDPQAMVCAACPKNPQLNANWKAYRETGDKSTIPGCEVTVKYSFIDNLASRVYMYPVP